jgi:hypothetical protein
MNACKHLSDDRNDGIEMTNRQRVTQEFLRRFGILNRGDLEMAVLAERDTSAWNNFESEEKSEGLRESTEMERISGKGVEGESEGEDESEEELKEENEDAESVAARGLRQWTFWL